MRRLNADFNLLKKERANSVLPSVIGQDDDCYYLSRDYAHYTRLSRTLPDGCSMVNLGGTAPDELEKIRAELLELFARLNERHDSLAWWGTVLASRTSMTIPLQLNVVFLTYMNGLMEQPDDPTRRARMIIIADSQALLDSITVLAKKRNMKVSQPGKLFSKSVSGIRLVPLYLFRVTRFLWHCFRNSRQAHGLLDPLTDDPAFRGQRTIIRSWVTPDSFTGSQGYTDRNFGDLPEEMAGNDHQVVILPMFIDVNLPLKEMYRKMKGLKVAFLIQYHYLKLSDYIAALMTGFRQIRTPMKDIVLDSLDLSLLFREIQLQQGFNQGPLTANLCYPLLKRLRDIDYRIDAFFYPFENNVPEKTFILACRKYYPDSGISAYQHTVWFRDQLGMILAENESEHHPIADRIICSGPIFPEILKEAGFPGEIIESGPSLRFTSVFDHSGMNENTIRRPNILLPLNYSDDQSYELIHKVKLIQHALPGIAVYLRKHPVLDEKALRRFLNDIHMSDYQEADGGSIQEWLINTDMVITTGATVVILEAAIMGIPVIRVVPDNDFILDPLSWSDYPIEPVNSPAEIGKTVAMIMDMPDEEHDRLRVIGREILSDYFQEANEHNLEVFSRLP